MSFKMIKTQPLMTSRARNAAIAKTQAGTPYTLVVQNNSTSQWDMFVYQQDPGASTPDVFSLAWFSTPAAPNTKLKFHWSVVYDYVFSQTGTLAPGVTFEASQTIAADPISTNLIQFSEQSGAPTFGQPTSAGTQGSLTIVEDGSVVPNTLAVGIGMAGFGTFVVQAQPNVSAIFTPTPTYWLAFGSQKQQGVVLETQVGNNIEIVFPENVYTLYATLSQKNIWTTSTTPG